MGFLEPDQNRKFRQRARIEDPELGRTRILSDAYLRSVYEQSLRRLLSAAHVDPQHLNKRILELGSSGGITKDLFESIVTSDVRPGINVDYVEDACDLSFDDESFDGIIAKDVLHHLPDIEAHFHELGRVLKRGASAAYLEPNWNRISRLVFTRLHPEPYDPAAESWTFTSSDPMYANQALPWIVFQRDLAKFHMKFPDLSVQILEGMNGLAFLASGGVYSRTPVPEAVLRAIDGWEARHSRIMAHTALNRIIVVTRIGPASD